jgi:hypothetical protein
VDVPWRLTKLKNLAMKHLLITFLLLNAIFSTLWACGSGPKPVHYGVHQSAKTASPVAGVTNSVVSTTNKISTIK